MVYAMLVAVLLLLPCLAPGIASRSGARRDESWPDNCWPGDRWLAALLVGGGFLLTFLRGWELVEVSILLALPAAGRNLLPLAGAAAAALLFAPAIWWIRSSAMPLEQHLLLAGICLGLAVLSRWASFAGPAKGKAALSTPAELAIVGTLLVLGLGAGLLTGAANEQYSVLRAWHHWGAYISPVSAMLAGGVPYRDFPVQYGMGPTLLIAASCPMGCWTGVYSLTVVANALELAALSWSLLLLTRRLDTPSRLLALGALVCAMVIWTGYPLNWGSQIMTPSVGGMRFLPLVLLLSLILTAELGAPPSAAGTSGLPRWIAASGHGLWLLGLAWSPEGAFFTSLVWWPYLALRRAVGGETGRSAWPSLLRGGVVGLAAVLAGYAALALLFRLVFGDWVLLGDYLLYLRYPPGLLPVNTLGLIWFAAAIMLLACRALLRADRSAEWRSLYICLLAAFAALSYYLSRSHDNNLLNLLPFLLLVLLATQALLPTPFASAFVRTTLVATIAFTASINFHPWTVYPGATTVAGLQVGSGALTMRFTPSLRQAEGLVPQEAAAAFDDLHSRGIRQVVLFDGYKHLPLDEPGEDWTSVNNLANFMPLPQAEIRRYIRRGAVVYHRPGWIVLSRKDYGYWLGLFQTSYDVIEEWRYGGYSAYHMVPRDVY